MSDLILPAAEVVLPNEQNPALVYLASLSTVASRSTMRSALQSIAKILGKTSIDEVPWHLLRYQHVEMIRSELLKRSEEGIGLCPSTVRHRLAALRGTLERAWKLGLMSAEDYHRARATEAVRGERLPPGRMLSMEEMSSLFEQVEAPSPRNARDGAILALLCAGLRRFEIVSLDVDSFEEIAGNVRLIGKGNKERRVRLPPGSLRMVKRWLKYRGEAPGPMILPIDGRGMAYMKRCCEKVVPDMLAALGKRAKLAHFTAHDFRRTLISGLLDQNVDIVTVARTVGHASVTTTERYDRRKEDAVARAMDGVHVPSRFWEEEEEEENNG